MAFMEETKEKIVENGSAKDTASKMAGTPEALPPQPAPIKAIALPDETMNKIILILRKMSYESVGELMDEIRREAINVNVQK